MRTDVEHRATNDNALPWSLNGPDADGAVWIHVDEEECRRAFNLGSLRPVHEAIADALCKDDWRICPDGARWRTLPWTIEPPETDSRSWRFEWRGEGPDEDFDLGGKDQVAEILLAFVVEHDDER
ncbi:hypothetical protein [Sphingosinicella sp. BN140058]|uniref:hypothetical protein n=1 Tax=Sphingosinicella sp. BN140058 TaxID=1892855 RepID=UPI0010106D1E|nr:hypothetical protein [Sphingosinicella sp. BN140058]QAY77938.1 hypothetical protein ETR14_16460 [Sphingosinicella sp. BN140058]